jgi:hypothetical protein
MRLLLALPAALAALGLFIGPGPAREDDEADRDRRLAEIRKEIQELQARLAKLAAEAASLEPPPEVPAKRITAEEASAAGLHGAIRNLRFSPDGRTLLCSNSGAPAVVPGS